MYMDDRTTAVFGLLDDYVRSPSLRHLRDERALAKIAREIVAKLDQKSAIWKKWEGPREVVLASALDCWIPKEDLLAYLNGLPGPLLTSTDLEQRMKHLIEVDSIAFPEPKLRNECLAIYHAEVDAGTEMPAIIGRIVDYNISQFQRLRDEEHEEERLRLEKARLERERKLLSYADCPWTQIKGSQCFCCRKNGRLFQLKPNSDKSWNMYRVLEIDDTVRGELIGRYRSRGDAAKVVTKAAFEPGY